LDTVSRGSRSAPRKARFKRFFIALEISTTLLAIVSIGLYGNFLGTLGVVSYHLKRYDLAEALLRSAVWVQQAIHGSRSLSLNEPLNDLAYFYYDRNKPEEAVPIAARSLSICEDKIGRGNSRCAWTLSVLSLTNDGAGNFVQAEQMATEALPILEASEGQRSSAVASTLNRLGLALDGEGRYPEAEVVLRRALTIRESFGGANWDGLVPVLENLERVYTEEGNDKEAVASRERIEKIQKRQK
jgi:tetratricopeptide (TPR) repeat protein